MGGQHWQPLTGYVSRTGTRQRATRLLVASLPHYDGKECVWEHLRPSDCTILVGVSATSCSQMPLAIYSVFNMCFSLIVNIQSCSFLL